MGPDDIPHERGFYAEKTEGEQVIGGIFFLLSWFIVLRYVVPMLHITSCEVGGGGGGAEDAWKYLIIAGSAG